LAIDSVNLRTCVRCARMNAGQELLQESLLPGGNVEVSTLAAAKGGELAGKFFASPLESAAQLGASLTAPGSGRLTAFERACDDALTAYLAQARRVAFGEQPVVGYLCAREAEATAIRTILSGRRAGLSGEAIRERLRECYV
jgi:V/A-type H+-transporting ATPase subunit C